MTRIEFDSLVQKGIIILDGATGSNLLKAGMPRAVCTEQWILEHRDVMYNLQKAYVEAGSQIIYAPTFTANRLNLKDWGLEDKTEELVKELVSISKEAAAGKAFVAGDLTTTGKAIGSSDEWTYEFLLDFYKEQIRILVEAGVDLLIAETMIGIDETMAAVDAATSVCDLPIMCTLTVEADGSVFSGGNIKEAVETLQEMGACAIGLNCSVGPDQLESVVAYMKTAATVPLIAKPNAGLPEITETGEAVYSMNQSDFARNMGKLFDAGASILGGCCGTDPEYIKTMIEYLKKENKC